MLYMHPVLLLISLISAIIYSTILNKEKFKQTLSFASIIILGAIIANAMFVNRGFTVLFYFRQNPVTLESISYGLCAGIMMASVVVWFSCYN